METAESTDGRADEIIVLDTESSGLGPRARIIEFAAVVYGATGSVIDRYETLIHCDGSVGPTNIHGIEASMLAAAPRFADVAGMIASLLQGRVVVGHGLSHDWRLLRREFARLQIAMPRRDQGHCTAEMSAHLFDGRRPSLSRLCSHLGIVNHRPHSAAGDAQATAEAFWSMRTLGLPEAAAVPCPRLARAAFQLAFPLPRVVSAIADHKAGLSWRIDAADGSSQ